MPYNQTIFPVATLQVSTATQTYQSPINNGSLSKRPYYNNVIVVSINSKEKAISFHGNVVFKVVVFSLETETS